MIPQEIIARLQAGNDAFVAAKTNPSDISAARREELVKGQHPIATVITCSDSRVVPEHIFSVGLGEIFVIRTAGNVVSDYESGSVEYAVDHLHTGAVIVLGHTHCGAVGAARETMNHHNAGIGNPRGLNAIISEISRAIHDTKTATEAVRANVNNSVNRLLENHKLLDMIDDGKTEVFKAVYDLDTGKVEFFK